MREKAGSSAISKQCKARGTGSHSNSMAPALASQRALPPAGYCGATPLEKLPTAARPSTPSEFTAATREK